MSRNVVQASSAFPMKDKIGDSLGMMVSRVGLLAVFVSAMFFSQYIGFLPALPLSAIVVIVLVAIIRAQSSKLNQLANYLPRD